MNLEKRKGGSRTERSSTSGLTWYLFHLYEAPNTKSQMFGFAVKSKKNKNKTKQKRQRLTGATNADVLLPQACLKSRCCGCNAYFTGPSVACQTFNSL